MIKSKIKILFLGLISCLCISCTSVYLRVPNAPFFADPNYNGSTDPEIIYNPVTKEFLVYYTSRRPLSGNSFVSTPIGVISSKNLLDWTFKGYCSFDGNGGDKDSPMTFWAPGMIVVGDSCHMYVTRKEDSTPPWGGPSKVVHYVAPLTDMINGWRFVDVAINEPNAIDACLFKNSKGSITMIYRNCLTGEPRCGTFWATSTDLKNWEKHGLVHGDVENVDKHGFHYQEGPNVIFWKDYYWLITDPHCGLPVYRSKDGIDWNYQGLILDKPGNRLYDGTYGRHASMIVTSDDRAFIVYHVEPLRNYVEYDDTRLSIVEQLCFLQIAELKIVDGKLICERDALIHLRE